jgi:hypothetical protein
VRDGVGSQIIGGIVVVFIGIFVIAGIYQLQNVGPGSQGVLSTAQTSYTNTLNSIFK